MKGQSEAWRRAVAASVAIALCAVVAGMVGEAVRFLTRAYDIQQASVPTAAPEAAPPRVIADTTLARVRSVPSRPVVRRPRLSKAQAATAVMSAAFPYRGTVLRAAARHAVDPALVFAIIASESRGDPDAVSPCGAIGLMQLMPSTASELGVDPWKPEENIEGAVRYLALLLEQFKSVDLSLVAYNAGPGFAVRYQQGEVDLGAETRAFLMRVAGLQ